MMQEPHYYVEEVLQFKKITKEKRKSLILEVEKEIAFEEKVIAGRIKVRELESAEPDFAVRLKYNKQILSIMKIMSYELGD